MLALVVFILIQFIISQLSALAMTINLFIQRQSLRISTDPPRRSRFLVISSIEVENQQLTTAEGHLNCLNTLPQLNLNPSKLVVVIYQS